MQICIFLLSLITIDLYFKEVLYRWRSDPIKLIILSFTAFHDDLNMDCKGDVDDADYDILYQVNRNL